MSSWPGDPAMSAGSRIAQQTTALHTAVGGFAFDLTWPVVFPRRSALRDAQRKRWSPDEHALDRGPAVTTNSNGVLDPTAVGLTPDKAVFEATTAAAAHLGPGAAIALAEQSDAQNDNTKTERGKV
ncbi:hypothetical protein LZ30DRAFT_787740 [Colletotrichum cereale]|nr:hypothetical protein LZ30DRAFT_787740 [Colletotrichum cereale]